MLLYAKTSFRAAPEALVDRLHHRVAAAPRPSRTQAREWLVFAGQIAQAVLDSGGGEDIHALTACAARLFIEVMDGRDPSEAHRALRFALQRHHRAGAAPVAVRVPEGFAWYALYPDSYVLTARRWAEAHPGRRAAVIGLRSIGTSLGAAVAAALERAGAGVAACLSLRPTGHPFARQVALPEAMAEADAFIIVDEGPGLSGSSMAAVAAALQARGVSEAAIFFFPGHGKGPGLAAAEAVRRWWQPERCWVSAPDHACAGAAFAIFGGFAAVNADLDTLAEVKHARQQHLAERGFAKPFSGLENGWLTHSHRGTPLSQADGDPCFIRNRLAPYIAAAARPARSPQHGLDRIAAALLAFDDRLDSAAFRARAGRATTGLFHGDGRLGPGEWEQQDEGPPLKCDATGTDCDHSWTGDQCVLWDVAGALVEWRMTQDGESLLLRLLADRHGIAADPFALLYHRAGYCCLNLARATDPQEAQRYRAGLMAAVAAMAAAFA